MARSDARRWPAGVPGQRPLPQPTHMLWEQAPDGTVRSFHGTKEEMESKLAELRQVEVELHRGDLAGFFARGLSRYSLGTIHWESLPRTGECGHFCPSIPGCRDVFG